MREDTTLFRKVSLKDAIPGKTGSRSSKAGLFLLPILALLLSACMGPGVFSTTVWAGPVPVGDSVVLGTRAGHLVAVNIEDGSERWKVETKAGRAKLLAIYGTPATDGRRIYAGGFDGTLYAVDAEATGADRVLWSFPTDSSFLGGPVVAGDLVLAGTEAGVLYAIEADGPRAGEARWSFPAAGRIWSRPSVAGNLAYVGTLSGTVHAVFLRDDANSGKKAGEEKWHFKAQAGIGASPVVADDVLYVGSFDDRLYALDAVTGQERWPQPFLAENWFWAEPLVHEGRIYAPNMDHNVYVLNAQTGTKVRDPLRTGGAMRGAPALVDGRVVVANEAGETWWLDLQTGEARAGGGLEAGVYAPLATIGSTVYIYAQDSGLYTVTSKVRQPIKVYPLKK